MRKRDKTEKTERMIAEVIAVSRESELRTMNTLRTVLDRQSDLEAEMYSVDERETVIDNPAPSRWSSPRQGLGLPLAYPPPASDPQDDLRFLTPPPILRRSERLRHLQEKNASQSYREDQDETLSESEEADPTYSYPGASHGHIGQAWIERPGSPGLAPRLEGGSSKYVLPRRSPFYAAGGEEYLDDEREGSLGHDDPRGGPSKPIGITTGPTSSLSRRQGTYGAMAKRGSPLHVEASEEEEPLRPSAFTFDDEDGIDFHDRKEPSTVYIWRRWDEIRRTPKRR